MEVRTLEVPGLLEFKPKRFADERGYFAELFRSDVFARAVGRVNFVQENESLSVRVGTIRGLHFQTNPAAQGKLVRCTAGLIFDVAVDLRHNSPTYGRWASVELSPGAGNWLWIPPGFAHGFCTLAPCSVINYKVTHYYSAECDKGVRWDDTQIGINWPLQADPETLSAKDRTQPALAELSSRFALEL